MGVPTARTQPLAAWRRRLPLLLALLVAAVAAPAAALAHDGHDHRGQTEALPPSQASVGAEVRASVAAPRAASAASSTPLVEEPLIPGIDVAVDYDVAPNGDVYVAHQDGRVVRYRRAAGSTLAYPSYSLNGELIYDFSVTRQFDRGLVGLTLDAEFDQGFRFLYAVITRGSNDWVDGAPNGNPSGIRRTGAVVKIAVPASGPAREQDLTTIVGAAAPADPDQTCKPYMAGNAPPGETDALPNGVLRRLENGRPTVYPVLSDQHIYPDGDLTTRADGAYDCIPSDSPTHGMGSILSAPDGTLFFSVGDASAFDINDPASLRAFNLESHAGKILRVDRNGRGVAGHPFCPGETDRTRTCTKIWARGLRNAFRIGLLPPDGASGGSPVVAIGDVGNWTKERLTVAHPGDNLGWPCWEGTYWAYAYASPESDRSVRSLWGGPELAPAGAGKTSCERLAAGGDGRGRPTPSGVKMPTLEYEHEQLEEPAVPQNGAAITSPGRLTVPAGADPAVALPAAWDGSLLFGDFVRGWMYRLAPDATDPGNADLDGGVRAPADEGRGPGVQTDWSPSRDIDPLLERVAEAPPKTEVTDDDGSTALVPSFYRVTSRTEADGTLWSMHYGDANVGGLWRVRRAPEFEAVIESVVGECASGNETQGNIVLTAADAGAGATYRWDIDGDGVADPGRTARTTTITPEQLPDRGWVRLTIARGGSQSVAAKYVCSGPLPVARITSPASGTEVVLGEPIVIRAERPAGDAEATGVPDSQLAWRAATVHGSSHEHPLLERTPPFETVDGQQRLQATITPDSSHELGSFTRVKLVVSGGDGSAVSQTLRLVPKPVDVTFKSSPEGARISVRRDVGESVIASAPGTIELAAGFSTEIAAPARFVDASGAAWQFVRWSDGETATSRGWGVRHNDGDAPVAEYRAEPSAPTPTPPADPPVVVTAVPELLPPTGAELRLLPLATRPARAARPIVAAELALPRPVDASGLVTKIALRDAKCRWWSFSSKRFVARGGRSRAARRRACAQPVGWKLVRANWSEDAMAFSQPLGRRVPKGRYALRVRVTRGREVLADRLRSVRVR